MLLHKTHYHFQKKPTVGTEVLAGSSDIATNLHDNGAKWHEGCAIEFSR